MQGVGYGGFVAWSAAKRLPPALKAIATSDPMAPGIDVPSPNGIFLNSAYRWAYDILAPPDDDAGERRCSLARASTRTGTRSGRRYREFPTLPGRASSDLSQLVESPELRPVLAKVAAVRRRVRERRHTGAHRHRVLLGRRNRCAVLFHAAPQPRCQRRSRIADRPVRLAGRRARRFGLGSRARPRPGRAHRPERRALRMVRPCARKARSGRRYLERHRQLRARRRERMAARAVARGARKHAPALLPRGLAERRASSAGRGEARRADGADRDARSPRSQRRRHGGPRRSSFSGNCSRARARCS